MATVFEWGSGSLPGTPTGGISVDGSIGQPAAPSIEIAQTSGNPARTNIPVSLTGVSSTRFYFRTPSAWGGSAAGIFNLNSAPGTIAWQLTLAGGGAPGQYRIVRDGGPAVYSSSTGTLAFDTWYRAEVRHDPANEAVEVDVFPATGTTPIDSGSGSHANLGSVGTQIIIGRNNSSPTLNTFYIDSITVTDTFGLIGEYVEPDPPSGLQVSVWNGTDELPATVSVWNGTDEVPATIDAVN